mmetsp:Transcript_19870/g.30269  ORF Transcript_19870/g.30269 Transcript_19870/m.30269 type:complete len:117 (+) Transcript_19870:170-520(+)
MARKVLPTTSGSSIPCPNTTRRITKVSASFMTQLFFLDHSLNSFFLEKAESELLIVTLLTTNTTTMKYDDVPMHIDGAVSRRCFYSHLACFRVQYGGIDSVQRKGNSNSLLFKRMD